MRRAAILLLLPIALLAAAGCTYSWLKVNPEGAEQSLANYINQRDRYIPTAVSCPTGVPVVPDREFVCHFRGPKEQLITAHLKITKVHKNGTFSFSVRTSQQG